MLVDCMSVAGLQMSGGHVPDISVTVSRVAPNFSASLTWMSFSPSVYLGFGGRGVVELRDRMVEEKGLLQMMGWGTARVLGILKRVLNKVGRMIGNYYFKKHNRHNIVRTWSLLIVFKSRRQNTDDMASTE